MPSTGEMASAIAPRPRPAIARRPRRAATSHIGRKYWRAIWPTSLLLLYVFGGAIQYLGWLTPTQCNMVVLAIFCSLFLRRRYWRTARYEWPLLLLAAYFVVSGIVRGTPGTATAVYLYYLTCGLLAAPAGRLLAEDLINRQRVQAALRTALTLFIFLELPIVALQHLYAGEFAAHAASRLGAVDAVFGTFPMNSDSVLAACSVFMVIIYSRISSNWWSLLKIVTITGIIIGLGHSKAFQGTYAILIIPIIVAHLYRRTALHRYRVILMLLGALAITVLLIIVWKLAYDSWIQIRESALYQYSTRDAWYTAGRLAPFGQLLTDSVSHLFFGHGALTYYNPFTKIWLYDSGFSTIYSMYVDFGIIALVGYAGYQVRIIFSLCHSRLYSWLTLCIWLSFITFNDVLPNVAFIFAMNFTLSIVGNYVKRRETGIALIGSG